MTVSTEGARAFRFISLLSCPGGVLGAVRFPMGWRLTTITFLVPVRFWKRQVFDVSSAAQAVFALLRMLVFLL